MIKVYFDSNVFQYLKSKSNNRFVVLDSLLRKHKELFLPSFSHAHILDLKRDQTDRKFEDLKFMEEYVQRRYICYHFLEKQATSYIASPLEAFNDDDSSDLSDFNNLFDFNELKKDSLIAPFISVFEQLWTDQKISFPIPDLSQLSTEHREATEKLFGGKYEYTLKEWTEHFMSYSNQLMENKSEYKELRNYLDKYLNRGRFKANGSVSFDRELKDSELQKTFIDFVYDNIHGKKRNEISEYDFHTQAYFTLDMLGISSEKIKGRNKLSNLMRDAYHSYYAGHNDYLIAEDEGLLTKSNILYTLLNIETKALTTDHFLKSSELILRNNSETIDSFFKSLAYDLKHGIRLNIFNSFIFDRTTEIIKSTTNYLSFFNTIQVLHDSGETILVLEKIHRNYARYNLYEEFESVVNRAIELFGMDIDGFGKYKSDESTDIRKKTWVGRRWKLENIKLNLEINKGNSKFCLWVNGF